MGGYLLNASNDCKIFRVDHLVGDLAKRLPFIQPQKVGICLVFIFNHIYPTRVVQDLNWDSAWGLRIFTVSCCSIDSTMIITINSRSIFIYSELIWLTIVIHNDMINIDPYEYRSILI